jgi:hypothetical protein
MRPAPVGRSVAGNLAASAPSVDDLTGQEAIVTALRT